jgi:mannose-6-phosphate isomerase-like protein (cupin superfamily)
MAAEGEAAAAFAAAGVSPHRWSNGPGATYPAHRHGSRKLLVCVRGAITFHTPEGDVTLGPGDRLDLQAGVAHSATVGPDGVECLEAAIGPDRSDRRALRPAGGAVRRRSR